MSKKRILILEDEMVIARDLEVILNQMQGCELEIANSSSEFLAVFPQFQPHLALCDINLEEKLNNGLTLAKKMRQHYDFGLIFVTAHSDKQFLNEAGKLNPLGYILKPFEPKQVIAAVDIALGSFDVREGGLEKSAVVSDLTEREYDILKLISEGMTTVELADALFISPKTVENHRRNIARKLDLEPKNNSLQSWALANRAKI